VGPFKTKYLTCDIVLFNLVCVKLNTAFISSIVLFYIFFSFVLQFSNSHVFVLFVCSIDD